MKDTKEEKMPKAPKAPKVKKAKASKYPEWYIGRPKPMKTKTWEWHKPTKKFYVGLGIVLAILGFITYIVIRLINVSHVTDVFIKPYEHEEEMPETYVLENDKLRFEMDVKTTQFSVLQKDNGHVWYSNPVDVDSDPIALVKEKNNMKSTFLVKYSTENGVDNVYDTYTYSIKRDFFDVKKSANEITVDYTISQMEREFKYPLAIYEEDMDEYLEKMSKADQNVITKRCYRLVDIDNLKSSDNEAELLRKYPGLEDDNLYLIFNPLNSYLKVQCESIFEKIGYSDEDYLRHRELYKEVNEKIEPAFCLTVSYKLDGNDLIVDIPFDKILYRHTFPIVQLSVLPYFGAGGTSSEGYMLVPEGGGAVINFNNGKTRQNNYYADVYGWDYGSDRSAVITETRAAYPVFGLASENSGFISIIKNGAEYAGINAEIAGKLASYNYIRADYKMIHGEQFEVSSRNTSAQYSYEKSLPAGERITQIYRFINSNSYVDMAKAYRNYLFANEKKVNNEETPLAIELVGAVDKVQQVAGVPKTKPYKLTDYSSAASIINEVENMGIKNVSYKLSGDINGGIRQQNLKKFKFIKQLGGKSGFKKLIKDTQNTSAKLYLDASTQFAHRSGASSGFNKYRDAARFASDEIAELSEYSKVWYGKLDTRDTYFFLNPKAINKASDVLAKNASKYGLAGISYRDNGYVLGGDYNDNGVISRANACKQQVGKMQEAKDMGLKVMINAGNDYAIKSADFVTNVIFHGNDYAIIDYEVPFYQIALHGYKNYSGSPINLSYENEQLILESAETAASLYFTFIEESERKLQETYYTEYYAACFDTWKDKLETIYKEYDKNLSCVKNATISDHKYLNDTVTLTSFDNGNKVYVNYGYVDYVTDSGIKIPARQYKVQQGGRL